jgi:pantoate--beta-alanine ligase
MVDDLNMDVTICVEDTMRDTDGLALSSRNAYLTVEERKAAPVLYRGLCQAQAVWEHYTKSATVEDLSANVLREAVLNELRSEPLVTDMYYVAVDHPETMQALDHVHPTQGAIVSIACRVGQVRLIDNVVLSPKSSG